MGEGEDLFAILCHMDVVPAADQKGWNTDPFDPVIKDGIIYGRGSQDDKGPSMAALYAVKALMDHSFPLTFAEKGLLQAYLVGPGTDKVAVNAGGALNVVPDTAPYEGEYVEAVKASLDKLGFPYEMEGDAVVVQGKSVHAKDAPEGINAITRLAMALSESVDFAPLNFLGKLVKENATGENVVGKTQDEQSGELTMNFASLVISPTETKIGVDMRLPVTVKKEDLEAKIAEKVKEYDLTYEEFDWLDSLYVPQDSTLVKTLLATYREMTGDMSEPEISGGATFARTMKNCVAYGAMFEDTPDFMHQANEQWELDQMYKAMDIYAESIYRLCAK